MTKTRLLVNDPLDAFGNVDLQIKHLEAQREVLRDQIIKQFGPGNHKGRFFKVYVIEGVRATLPIDTAKKKLEALGVTPAWFRRHTKTTDITTVIARCTTAINLVKAA
jgi:hypothetical protein